MWFLKGRNLSFSEVDRLCDDLARKASKKRFDAVVGIETGGLYPAAAVAERLDLPFHPITVRRHLPLKTLYGRFPAELRFIPAVCHGVLFLTSAPLLLKGLGDLEASMRGQRVLVVDDASQTGKTLAVAQRYLAQLGARSKTAVLSSAWRSADYTCISGIRYYPWSACSPEYPRFVSLLQAGAFNT